MKLAEHKDLKVAITDLPIKEKDKLLLRLIAKDKVLTEHLHYKILEDIADLDERKKKIKANVLSILPELKDLNAREALVKVRKMITEVNHFYKVTKDVYGELELKIFILTQIPTKYKKGLFGYRDFGLMFSIFYIKTATAVFNKFKKLHEDLQFDLTAEFNELLLKIHSSSLTELAETSSLPRKIY